MERTKLPSRNLNAINTSIRCNEVARLEDISEAVFKEIPQSKKVLNTLLKRSTYKRFHLARKPYAKGLKEPFWLLLRIWAKVTRSAERNKAQEYKTFEWNVQNSPVVILTL
ncbi:MAG: hypothetical protein ACTIM4_01695 [Marinomonas sp.]